MSIMNAVMQGVKAALPVFPDRVTFYRISQAKGSAGGNLPSEAATNPSNIPCVYDLASGSERQLAGKAISGTAYMLTVPATYNATVVDVDAKCKAVVAANSITGQPQRTFQIHWVGRVVGAIVQVLASLEE
jgi:hypothetical protein